MEYKKVSQEIFNPVNENLKKLAELFPSAVKDGELDIEALKEELGEFKEVGKEKFELTWAGKQDAKKKAQEILLGKTLKYIPEDSKNPDTTENLYIEGDNLEALKLLRENYYGTVDVIYIDPPYNTGSDFIYNDNFITDSNTNEVNEGDVSELGERYRINQKSSNRYHANWLNMMYPRLVIAKDLLAEDGVIFISIDNDEYANLKEICDEIFKANNYVETFIWTKTSTPPSLSNKSRKTVEYVLCYEKKKNDYKYYGDNLENGDAPLLNSGNPVKTLYFPKGTVKFTFIENGILNKGEYNRVKLFNDVNIVNGLNDNGFTLSGEFKWSSEMLNEEINKGTYFLVKSDKFSIRFQRRDDDNKYKTPTNFLELKKENGVGTNETAVKEISELDMKDCFSYPKPVSLIKKLVQMKLKNKKFGIVLDFFSGSATSAHAVMEMNAEDNGKRKFIMIQLPENLDENLLKADSSSRRIIENAINLTDKIQKPHILSELGKERIRRAGEKIKEEYKDKEEIEDLDIGFKVFRVADTNIRWTKEALKGGQLDLDESMLSDKDGLDFVPGFTDIDVVYEIMLRQRDIPLSSKIEKLDYIGNRTYMFANSFVVSLEEKITEEMVEALAAIEPLPIKYIFRDSAFEDDIELKDTTFRKLQALIERNTGEKKKTYTVEFI